MKKIGFIDYFLNEWHADNYPAWIDEVGGNEFTVSYAWGKINPENKMTNRQWAEKNNIELLPTIEDVIDKSDYLVVLSPDNPEMHEELCSKPLASGKRTYVDKTFAPDRASAIRIFEYAQKYGTPLFSSSALRFAEEYTQISKDGIDFISSWGPGKFQNYSIHQIEPVVSLMGTDVKRIMSIGTEKSPAILLQYADGRMATINHFGWECPFSMAINYESGNSSVLSVKSDFFKVFISEMLDFFKNGQIKVDHKQTITIITIIEYGLTALSHPGEWIIVP